MSPAKRRKVDVDVPSGAQRGAEPALRSPSHDSEEHDAPHQGQEAATKSFKDLVDNHVL
jgi:hypothetical protein